MKNRYVGYVPDPYEGCDTQVAAGIKQILGRLITQATADSELRMLHPSYSLTSRRFSIWSVLVEHLQKPLDSFIRECTGGPWAEQLLIGFNLASLGRTPPKFYVDRNALSIAENFGGQVFDLGCLVVPAQSLNLTTEEKGAATTDRVIHGVKAWAENLRFVIRSLEWGLPNTLEGWSRSRFQATIESVFTLLLFLPAFRPKKGLDPFNEQEGAYPQLLDADTRIQSGGHCELCWRPTMRAMAMSKVNEVPSMKARTRSDRFCAEHNPSDPTSRYRADLRYKSAFKDELMSFTRSKLRVVMLPPERRYHSEVMKAVYDRVHSRIRPLTQRNRPSFREEVWQRHQRGMRQADIARELGTSRQSVFRSIKGTKRLIEIQESHGVLDPATWECWEKSTNSDLVKLVADLQRRGSTVAEIARATGHFKPTISSVLRWLSEQSTHTQS